MGKIVVGSMGNKYRVKYHSGGRWTDLERDSKFGMYNKQSMAHKFHLGTSNMSAEQCDLGSGNAIGDKGKRILGFTSLMTTPSIPEEEEEMPRVDVVYENIQNIPPLLKTYIKNPAKLKRKHGDEDPSEPSNVSWPHAFESSS
ncbi:hypothetical protein SUGI_0111390 [Cryptomeria japonica]|nr:hypothetical protein SUGI_0111390 [Cryptomeria japonica]